MSMAAKHLGSENPLKREAQLSRNVKLAAREYGVEHADVAMALIELGDFYHQQNREADSLDSYRRALNIYEALGEGHQLLQAIAMRSVSRALLALGKFSESLALDSEATSLIRYYQ